MSYYLKFSGAGQIIQPGTGGSSSDLIAVYEGVVWSDSATVTRILGDTPYSSVTLLSFSVDIPSYSSLTCSIVNGIVYFGSVHGSAFNYNFWTTRDNEATTASTITQGTGWPNNYYAGYKYDPDFHQYTSVTWTIVTDIGTFTASQIVRNNWNTKRDLIPGFVAKGY